MKKALEWLKILLLVSLGLILIPIKWVSTIIIKIFTFIEFKIADFIEYFFSIL